MATKKTSTAKTASKKAASETLEKKPAAAQTPAQIPTQTPTKTPVQTPAKAPSQKEASAPAANKASAKSAEGGAETRVSLQAGAGKGAPTHGEIAKRAHGYWEQRGRQHGSHIEDWVRAERELRGE